MALNFKKLTLISFVLFSVNIGFSQYGVTNEIGFVVGPVAFQSDFGERSDFNNTVNNTGIGVGIVHYLNFTYRRNYRISNLTSYFNEHFKVRNELSYNSTKLNHFGRYVASERTGINADKLRAHSGAANSLNIGSQLEFFPLNLRSFESMNYLFSPYVSIGAQYTFYNPDVETSYGDQSIQNSDNFYEPWVRASSPNFQQGSFLFDDYGSTLSLVGGVGTRIKATKLTDIVVDLKFQYFFDDKVDGLDHNLPSNKSNDWLAWFNVGYIFYLDTN